MPAQIACFGADWQTDCLFWCRWGAGGGIVIEPRGPRRSWWETGGQSRWFSSHQSRGQCNRDKRGDGQADGGHQSRCVSVLALLYQTRRVGGSSWLESTRKKKQLLLNCGWQHHIQSFFKGFMLWKSYFFSSLTRKNTPRRKNCNLCDSRWTRKKTFCYTLFLPFFFVFPFLNSNIKKCQLFATTRPWKPLFFLLHYINQHPGENIFEIRARLREIKRQPWRGCSPFYILYRQKY